MSEFIDSWFEIKPLLILWCVSFVYSSYQDGKSKNRSTAEFGFDFFSLVYSRAYNIPENEFTTKVVMFDLFITLNFCVC